MKSIWYLDLFWQWYLFFTINLNTYQHNFWEKLSKFTLKKITPLFHRLSSLKNPGQDIETNKIMWYHIYIVCKCCSKWHLSPPPAFFWSNLLYFQALTCSSFVIWQATGLSNVALEAQCMYLAGSLKNIDLKNSISTKSERFTARTGFDLYPSTLLYGQIDL